MRLPHAAGRRAGFTLIELLVVAALIIVLSALAAGVATSSLAGSQRVVSAADRASGWLLIAKQRASHDRAPRGVRFIGVKPDSATPAYLAVTEAQYIEQPDPWVPNPRQESNPTGARLVFATTTGGGPTVDAFFVSGTAADGTEFDQRDVSSGTLVLPELGGSFKLTTVPSPTPVGPSGPGIVVSKPIRLLGGIDLAAAAGVAPTGVLVTFKFAFQGQPRPLLGEPLLQMPSSTVIDVRTTALDDKTPFTSTTIGIPTPVADATPVTPTTKFTFDLLFTPSGQVLNATGAVTCLWVRDPSKFGDTPAKQSTLPRGTEFGNAGAQALICVYPRTGLIATQPPADVPAGTAGAYKFALDGRNEGL